ncbi:haloacid dehalogenase [Arthrobacter sp. ERGS1:01]|uniref:HAD hydrolase-like protein n=1 Tax=Arthrobacter sp. ERGS1:01 TaxID=1704044 RepID=UPI0006B56E3A|nr:HAD hydrolase-like protein [Arthrobacter sp. ERGS1:01]ALE05622.1 haloacid dehalogenase [Arthrobacter sp. ERGS1:01]
MILPDQSQPTLKDITCIFFDMDGTLLDSAPGVTSSAAQALIAVGAQVPPLDELRRFVGPPMIESFRTVSGLDEPTAKRAIKHYRAAYADHGAEQSSIYAGIIELLDQLKAAGIPMAVATSKVEDQAERLAQRFGITRHFANICGASDNEGRADKKQVIAELLLRLESQGVDVSNPVMIGDREYDVSGAAAHGIPTIFVSWGYGDLGEASHAKAIASSPEALLPMVLNRSRNYEPALI